MEGELHEAFNRLEKRIDSVTSELASFRQHKKLAANVKVGDLDDMLRLASLYSHDLARPSSTNGELALASCVEWLVNRAREADKLVDQLATRLVADYGKFGLDEVQTLLDEVDHFQGTAR